MPFSSFFFFSGFGAFSTFLGFAFSSFFSSFFGSSAGGSSFFATFLGILFIRLFFRFFRWAVPFYYVRGLDEFRLFCRFISVSNSNSSVCSSHGLHFLNKNQFFAYLQFGGYCLLDL